MMEGMRDPGGLVRRCRDEAGLTQRELAIRAGTTKTAVSRLEAGHISPTFETVGRLLLCLGYELALDAVPLIPSADPDQLAAVADLTPTERLDHALASRASLDGLIGAARGD